jgi:hypothetical protein
MKGHPISRRSRHHGLLGTILLLSMLASCLMGTDRQTWQVSVTTDKQAYGPDEPIRVTIHNGLAEVIYAVTGPSGRAMVHLERQVGTQWLPRDTGVSVHPTFLMAIEPQSVSKGVLSLVPSAQDTTAQPDVSEPTEPGTVQKDLRTLPPSQPWQPGDVIREVPNRRPLPQAQQSEMRSVTSRWDSGTYRLVIHFRIGAPYGPLHLSYSSMFDVTD